MTRARVRPALGPPLDPHNQPSARRPQTVSRTRSAAKRAAKPILDTVEDGETIMVGIKRWIR